MTKSKTRRRKTVSRRALQRDIAAVVETLETRVMLAADISFMNVDGVIEVSTSPDDGGNTEIVTLQGDTAADTALLQEFFASGTGEADVVAFDGEIRVRDRGLSGRFQLAETPVDGGWRVSIVASNVDVQLGDETGIRLIDADGVFVLDTTGIAGRIVANDSTDDMEVFGLPGLGLSSPFTEGLAYEINTTDRAIQTQVATLPGGGNLNLDADGPGSLILDRIHGPAQFSIVGADASVADIEGLFTVTQVDSSLLSLDATDIGVTVYAGTQRIAKLDAGNGTFDLGYDPLEDTTDFRLVGESLELNGFSLLPDENGDNPPASDGGDGSEVDVRVGSLDVRKAKVTAPVLRLSEDDFQFQVTIEADSFQLAKAGEADPANPGTDVPDAFSLSASDITGGLTLSGVVEETIVTAASAPVFSFEAGQATFSVGELITAEIVGLEVSYDPQQGEDQQIVALDELTLEAPALGLRAQFLPDENEPALVVYGDGFEFGRGRFGLGNDETVTIGPLVTVTAPYVQWNDFSYRKPTGYSLGGVSLGAALIEIAPESPPQRGTIDLNDPDSISDPAWTVSGSNISGTVSISEDGQSIEDVSFAAATINADLGFLKFEATDVAITPTATGDENLIRVGGTVTATVSAGPFTLTGSASKFSVQGDGDFVADENFQVSLDTSGLVPNDVNWPSFLPIQIDKIGARWADFNTAPERFEILVSASINNKFASLPNLNVSGSVTDLRIDPAKLADGENPLIDVGSVTASIEGQLFGNGLSATLTAGFLKLDEDGQRLPDGSLEFEESIFYGGIEGSFKLAGDIGTTIRLGFSERGFLSGYLSSETPQGILLDPASGLSIKNFRGGISFNATPLEKPATPEGLTNPIFQPTTRLTPEQWQDQLKQQVANQVSTNGGVIFDFTRSDAGGAMQSIIARLNDGTFPQRDANRNPSALESKFQELGYLISTRTRLPDVTVLEQGQRWKVQLGDALYVLEKAGSGSGERLRVSRPTLTLPTDLKSELNNGRVTNVVVSAFAAANIALPDTAIVTEKTAAAGGGISWEISAGDVVFRVTEESDDNGDGNGFLAVSGGGGAFEDAEKVIRIEAGGTFYSQHVPEETLSIDAEVIITTDGKFVVVGVGNFGGNDQQSVLEIDAKLFGDLSSLDETNPNDPLSLTFLGDLRPGTASGADTEPGLSSSNSSGLDAPLRLEGELTLAFLDANGSLINPTDQPDAIETVQLRVVGRGTLKASGVASVIFGGDAQTSGGAGGFAELELNYTDNDDVQRVQLDVSGSLSIAGLIQADDLVSGAGQLTFENRAGESLDIWGAVEVDFDSESGGNLSFLKEAGLSADANLLLGLNLSDKDQVIELNLPGREPELIELDPLTYVFEAQGSLSLEPDLGPITAGFVFDGAYSLLVSLDQNDPDDLFDDFFNVEFFLAGGMSLYLGVGGTTLSDLEADVLGVIVVRKVGLQTTPELAARFDLAVGAQFPGVDLELEKAQFQINTTGEDVIYEISDRFTDRIAALQQRRGETWDNDSNFLNPVEQPDGSFEITIGGAPTSSDGELLAAGPYAQAEISGYVDVLDAFRVDGDFRLNVGENGLGLEASGTLTLELPGAGDILNLDVGGTLVVTRNGLYGTLEVDREVDLNIAGLELGADVGGLLEVNTTGIDVDHENWSIAARSAGFLLDGKVTIAGFELDGLYTLTVNSQQLQMLFDANLAVAGFSAVNVRGTAQIIYSGANPGLILNTALRIDGQNGIIPFGSGDLFQLRGDLFLNVDTTRGFGQIAIRDLNLTVLNVIDLRGEAAITAGFDPNSGAFMRLAGNFEGDLLNILQVNASGFFDTRGAFDIDFRGGFVLGSNSWGIRGDVQVGISYLPTIADDYNSPYQLGVAGSASGRVRAFGRTIAGVGLALDFNSLTGRLQLAGSVRVLLVRRSVRFSIGYLPVNVVATPRLDLATLDASNGNLVLNVGDRAGIRELPLPQPRVPIQDEDYAIEVLRRNANGSFDVRVNGMGESQVFTGVRSVTGDFGAGNDYFQVIHREGSANDLILPVTVSGGIGDDQLLSESPGGVVFYGDDGSDVLIGGSGDDLLDGGAEDDFIVGNAGRDTITGGTGTDEIVWNQGDGREISIAGGADSDHLILIGGNNSETLRLFKQNNELVLTDGPSTELVSAGGFETVSLFAEEGGDRIEVEDLSGIGLETLALDLGKGGRDAVHILGTNQADTITVANLHNPDDPITITGFGPTIEVNAVSDRSDQLVLDGRGGDDTLRILPGSTAKSSRMTVSLQGGDGNDTLISTYATGTIDGGAGHDTITVQDPQFAHLTVSPDKIVANREELPNEVMRYLNAETLNVTPGDAGGVVDVVGTSVTTTVSGANTTVNVQHVDQDTLLNIRNVQSATLGQQGSLRRIFGAVDVRGAGTVLTLDLNAETDSMNLEVTNDTVTGLDSFMPAANLLRFGPDVELSLELGSGNDQVTVDDLTRRLNVNGGLGNDIATVTLRDAPLDGSAMLSTDAVESVIFHHTPTVATGTEWQIVGNSLRQADETIVQTAAAQLTIYNLSDGDDTLSILGGFDHLTEVNAGGGSDTIHVADPKALVGSDASQLALMTAPLILHGGQGTDNIILNDQQNLRTDVHAGIGTLDLVRGEVRGFAIPSDGGINFDEFESFVLNTGIGNYDITLIDSNISATLNFGSGADTLTINDHQAPLTVNLGDGDDTAILQGSRADLTLDGGDGGDEFRLDFSTLTTSAHGELVDSEVNGVRVAGFANLGSAGISANAFEQVDVTLTPFNDSLTVDFATADIQRVSLNGTGGDDRFLVQNVGSPTVVNAGSGQDIVTVAISGDPLDANDLSNRLTFDLGLEALTVDNSDFTGDVDWQTAQGALSVGNNQTEQRLLDIGGISETRIIAGSGENRLTINETADRSTNVSITENMLQVTSGEQILGHADFEQPVFTTPIQGLNGVTDTATIDEHLLAVSPSQNNLLIFPIRGGLPQRLIDGIDDVPAGILQGALRVEPYHGNTAIVVTPTKVSRFVIDASTNRWRFDGVLVDAANDIGLSFGTGINDVAVRDQDLYLLGADRSSLGIWRPGTGFVLTDLHETPGLVDLTVDPSTGNAHVVRDQAIHVVRPDGSVVTRDAAEDFQFGDALEQVETNADGTRLYILSTEVVNGLDVKVVNVYAREVNAQGVVSKHLQRFEVPETSVHLFVSRNDFLYLTQRSPSFTLESIVRYQLDEDGQLSDVNNPQTFSLPAAFQNSIPSNFHLYGGAASRNENPNLVYLRLGGDSFTISDDSAAQTGTESNNGYGGLYSTFFTTRTVQLPGSGVDVDIPFRFFQTQVIIGSGVGGTDQEHFSTGHQGHFVDATISVALSRDGSEYHLTVIGITGEDLNTTNQVLTYQFTIPASKVYNAVPVPVLEQTGIQAIPAGITAASHAQLDDLSTLVVAFGSSVDIYDVRPALQFPVYRGRINLGYDVLDLGNAQGLTYALLEDGNGNRKVSELSLSNGIGFFSTFFTDALEIDHSQVSNSSGTTGGDRIQGDSQGNLLLSGNDDSTGTFTGFVSSYVRRDVNQFNYTGTLRDGDEIPGQIAGLQSITVSADGKHVYAVDPQTDTLVILGWDSDTETLIGEPTVLRDQVGGQNHLGGIARIALHPNDQELFVVSDRDRKIVKYFRNPNTGQLQQNAVIDMSSLAAGETAQDLQIDADGSVFLVTNRGIHRVGSTGITASVALTDLTDLQLIGDGRLFVTQSASGRLWLLDQNLAVQKQIDGLDGATAVWHDAQFTIVTGGSSDSLFMLDSTILLDAANSTNPLVQTIVEGQAGVRGIAGASAVARSTSGDFVFVMGQADHTLAAFRVEESGNLQFAQFVRNGFSATLGLFDANSIVIHPTSNALLVGSSSGFGFGRGGLSVFAIDEQTVEPTQYNVKLESETTGGSWTHATVNTGSRADRVSIREEFLGGLSINTAGGTDFVDLASSGSTTTIDTGSGSDLVELRAGSVNAVVSVETRDGNDAVNIRRTGTDSMTTIETGTGADYVTAQGAELAGPVTLRGGDQNDTLTFFAAENSSTGNSVTPNGDIQVIGNGQLSYFSIETLSIFAPPLISITQPTGSFVEGQPLLLDASNSNLFGNSGTFEWDLNNDGVFGDVTGAIASVPWSELVALGIDDDGEYPLSLRVTTVAPDGQTLVSEQSRTFQVANAAPTLNLNIPSTGDVGTDYEVTLAASDPGNDVIQEWKIEWGDGTSTVYPGDTSVVKHQYQTTGTYTVTVTATDEDTSVVSSHIVTIDPVAPQVDPFTIAEGENLSLEARVKGTPTDVVWFVDSDGDGDYTDETALTQNLPTPVITWQQLQVLGLNDDELSPISLIAVVHYQDFHGDQYRTASVPTTLTITNTAPSAVVVIEGDDLRSEGDLITVQVTATDPSAVDQGAEFTYYYDFDDDGNYDSFGSTDSASFVARKAGTQRIRVTVVDKDGGQADFYASVGIDEVAPMIHVQGEISASEGELYTLQLRATDPGDDLITSWTVNWGDGDTETVPANANGSADLTHRYADDGSYDIQVTVVDNDGVYQNVHNVTVIDVAPEVAIERAETSDVFEGEAIGLLLGSVDPGDDRIVQWEINWGDGTTEILLGDQLDPTHVYQTAGTYTVTLDRIVTDERTIEAPSASLQLEVRDVAPVILTDLLIVPSLGTEAAEVSLSAVAAGPLGAVDTLTFVWNISGPDGYSLELPQVVTPDQAVLVQGVTGTSEDADAATEQESRYHSVASFVPPDDGDYTITLQVIDDDGNVVEDERQLAISNVAPVIDSVTLPSDALEGTPTTLEIATSDVAGDADPLTITWTLTNRVTGDVTTLSGETVGFTPDGGRYDVTITVVDGDGGIATVAAVFDVQSLAPRFLANGFTIPTGLNEGETANLSAVAEDVVGDSSALIYVWSITNPEGGTTVVPGRSVSFPFGDDGIYTAKVTVTNPQGDSTTSSSFPIDVANVAPLIETVTVPGSGQEGVGLAFSASASDYIGDRLTYQWTITASTLPEPIVLNGRIPTLTPADDGTYHVSLTVTDDDNSSTTVNAGTIDVANVAPTAVLQLPTETPVEGGVVTLSVNASDVPDDIADLAYQWSVLTPGETDSANAIQLTGSTVQLPTPHSGLYQITVTVDDGDGGQWTQTTSLPVSNVAPVIQSAIVPTQGFVGFGVDLSAEATDAGHDELTVTWQIIDPEQNVSTLTGINPVFVPSVAGDHLVSLLVSDSEGGEVQSGSLTLSVAATPISINSVVVPTVAPEGRTLDLRATALDRLDGSAVEFDWTITDENGGTVNLSGAEVLFLPADDGVYGVTITAGNGNGSTTVTRTIQVDNVAPRLVTLDIPGSVLSHRLAVLSALASDPNDALTYHWTITSPAGTVTELTGSEVEFQPEQVGFHAVELTIDDGDGGVVQVTELLAVTNSPPVADAGLDSYEVLEGGAVVLDASMSTDADQASETLIYEWDFDNDGIYGELGTQFGDEVGIRPIFLADHDGDAVLPVALRVTDQAGAQDVSTTSIHVQNAPPVIETLISSRDSLDNVSTNGRVSISGQVTDPGTIDTHVVRVDWGDGSPVQTIAVDPLTRTFASYHDYNQGGVYAITVTAIDKDGAASEPRTVNGFVQGIGLNNGTLFIVGTKERDKIDVKEKTVRDHGVKFQELRIKGKLDRDKFDIRVPANQVERIVILTLDGNDDVKVDVDSLIPVFIHGGQGDDDIRTKDGIALIAGGEGDDKIDTGDGVSFVLGGNGDDKIRTGDGISIVVGGRGDDDIDTGDGWSLIFGNAGDDKIDTGDGRAIVFAGDGDDKVRTRNGNDRVYGGNGDDDISTGKGNDVVFPGSGRDKVKTGSGNDVVLPDHCGDGEQYLALLDQNFAELFPRWWD